MFVGRQKWNLAPSVACHIVYLGLNTAIYFLQDFQDTALISNAVFMFLGLRDTIWPCLKNSEISDAMYTDCTGNTEPVRHVGRVHCRRQQYPFTSKAASWEEDDSTVSFFTHFYTFLIGTGLYNEGNYSLSTFSFALLSTLKSHTHCTQYLK